ncbi:nitroreductase/quinone reductase family protein [Streptosporangium sp. 'caverna']|uniref:nitroreductase/quinone reductase family protein n=1 Tax=Streptosporangium sp. 'caverna' TaxID=2202249 RepID=UPI0013A6CEB3|nr:nitroreductase/quinone reductase family protein [Streptosporangium sp. 'caverna']
MTNFNEQVIAEFRANNGVVGGYFEGMNLVLLHHTGKVTGQERVTPMGYTADGTDVVVVGSNGGGEKDPAWVTNIAVMSETTIEVGDRTLKVKPSIITDPVERARLYAEVKKAWPGVLEGYEKLTTREFKVVRLSPIG